MKVFKLATVEEVYEKRKDTFNDQDVDLDMFEEFGKEYCLDTYKDEDGDFMFILKDVEAKDILIVGDNYVSELARYSGVTSTPIEVPIVKIKGSDQIYTLEIAQKLLEGYGTEL